MSSVKELDPVLERISSRLEAIDEKLEGLTLAKRKSMEWIAQLSEHIGSLDAFREEVRATLEPLYSKLEVLDDNVRILRHATSDVSRRVDGIEQRKKTVSA